MCEPTTMLMIASTVAGGVGSIQQGQAANESAKYSAQVSQMNADMADRAARDALERGKLTEQKQRRENAQLQGAQVAAMAANGVDLSFGSPLDLIVDTAKMGEIDALTIRSNTAREERDIRQQALNYRGQAGADLAAGRSARTAGYLGAAGTVLGGGAKAYGQGKTAGIW